MFEMRFRDFVLGPLMSVIIAVITLFLYLKWIEYNEASEDFESLFYEIHADIAANHTDNVAWLNSGCQRVVTFMAKNPIKTSVELDCKVYASVDSLSFLASYQDFRYKTSAIEDDYEKQEDEINFWMFMTPIVLQFSAWGALRILKKMDNETGRG